MTTNPCDTSGARHSVWLDTSSVPLFTQLHENIQCDVCVIGAGMAGLSTAYQLQKQGLNVVVLEDGLICSGETGRTTAHITNAFDDRYYEMIKLHGEQSAKLLAQSHTAAIDCIEQIVIAEQIDCDFERIEGFPFQTDAKTDELQQELHATEQVGLHEVALLNAVPTQGLKNYPCLRFPNQAQFHPIKYLSSLAQIIARNRGKIFDRTHAKQVRSGSTCTVETTQNYTVNAKQVVIATNSPITNITIHTKQAPYRTYVIGIYLPEGSVQKALYWDTEDPYHYVRLQSKIEGDKAKPGYELLIVGGEDHRTGDVKNTEECFEKLTLWTRYHFPMAEEIAFQWSGQVLEPIDGVGFIGKSPGNENTFIITGDSGNGITHGTIASMLLTDLIIGKQNPWSELYDPCRKTLRAAKEFAQNNASVAADYLDYFTPGQVRSEKEIAPDSGAVIRCGLSKIAAYRDKQGSVHQYSAICPHMGGLVHWNNVEKTWDCPCHGSRFDKHGHLLNGPANSNLKPIHAKEHKESLS